MQGDLNPDVTASLESICKGHRKQLRVKKVGDRVDQQSRSVFATMKKKSTHSRCLNEQ